MNEQGIGIYQKGFADGCLWVVVESSKCWMLEYVKNHVKTLYGMGEWDFIWWNTIGGKPHPTGNPTTKDGKFYWRLRNEG